MKLIVTQTIEKMAEKLAWILMMFIILLNIIGQVDSYNYVHLWNEQSHINDI